MASPKRQALGRGLTELIPNAPLISSLPSGNEAKPKPGVLTLDIAEVKPNPEQPRSSFDEAAMEELAASVKTHGLMQPILVRKTGSQSYEIIAGERRWRACQRAGLQTIEVIVKDLLDEQLLEWALIENIQREDLNPIEEAEAFKRLLEIGKLTQEQLAEKVGKERSSVANALRLLKLPSEVRHQVVAGALSMGHARALLALPSDEAMIAMGRNIVKGGLSVREVERLVRQKREPREKTDPYAKLPGGEPAVRQVTESLEKSFGTRVKIVPKGAGGKIEIGFSSAGELNRLLDLFGEQGRLD